MVEKFYKIKKRYWEKKEIFKIINTAPDIDRVGEHLEKVLNFEERGGIYNG